MSSPSSPPSAFPAQRENEQLKSHVPVPACQGGAGTEAQSDRPSGEVSGREQTEAKNPQAPQAVAPAPGKTALSRWRSGASQRVPIKARPQFTPSLSLSGASLPRTCPRQEPATHRCRAVRLPSTAHKPELPRDSARSTKRGRAS